MHKFSTSDLKEILNSKRVPIINLTTGDVKRVDDIGGNKFLKSDDYKGTGIIKEYRREYVNEIINVHFNFDEYFKIEKTHINRKEKLKKNPKYKPRKELKPLPIFPLIKNKDIWEWRINKFSKGEINLKEKKDTSIKSSMEIPEWLRLESVKRNRLEDVLSFSNGIPLTPKSEPIINQLLELIKNNLDDFFHYLARYEKIAEWVWEDNIFWNSVNKLEFKGAGASEILAVLLFKGASMMGGGVSYDLLIENNSYPSGLKIELKSDITGYGSFRISKSSIASFDIFNKVCELCIGIMRIFNEYSYNEIRKHITNEEFISLKNMIIDNDNEISLYKQWRSVVEFNENRLRQLQLFLYYFSDITKRTTLFNKISDHEYILKPENLFKDLHDVVNLYFENHDIDKFIFVRNGEILRLNKEDISFGEITSGNVKIIETSRAKRRDLYDETIAYNLWKENKVLRYSEVYNKYQEN